MLFFVRDDLCDRLSVEAPSITDLSKYTQNYIRESLSEDGTLSSVNAKDRSAVFSNCKVFEIGSGTVVRFKDLGK